MDAKELDARYHLAKLFGLMMTEEGSRLAWQEHEQQRAAILGTFAPGPPAMGRDEWLARVAAIDQKMRKAGLVPPHSGVMN